MPKQFAFCSVCRRNHDQGKGHKYGVKHKQRRDQLLGTAHRETQEVLLLLRNVTRLSEGDKGVNKFWCHFCQEEIGEQDSVFACSNTIRHLGSSRHLGRVKAFWIEHGGDFQKQRQYFITAEDLQKWQAACDAAVPGTSEGQTFEDYVLPLQHCKDGNFQDLSSASPLEHAPPFEQTSEWESLRQDQVLIAQTATKMCRGPDVSSNRAPDSIANGLPLLHTSFSSGVVEGQDVATRSQEGTRPSLQTTYKQNLTSIPRPTIHGLGNVHTGAPPPWLKADSGVESSSAVLSRSQERKLAKLRNPKRVGAAWAERRRAELAAEHQTSSSSSAQTDAAWLPKFGRVWQSSRRDTRREFEAEKKLGEKRVSPALASSQATEVQPYISKRQRQESRTDSAI